MYKRCSKYTNPIRRNPPKPSTLQPTHDPALHRSAPLCTALLCTCTALQWTVHRNIERVNTMYRRCGFLTTDLMKRLKSHARYESAEGCYALQVSQSDQLNVKYAVKVFTGWCWGKRFEKKMTFEFSYKCYMCRKLV